MEPRGNVVRCKETPSVPISYDVTWPRLPPWNPDAASAPCIVPARLAFVSSGIPPACGNLRITTMDSV